MNRHRKDIKLKEDPISDSSVTRDIGDGNSVTWYRRYRITAEYLGEVPIPNANNLASIEYVKNYDYDAADVGIFRRDIGLIIGIGSIIGLIFSKNFFCLIGFAAGAVIWNWGRNLNKKSITDREKRIQDAHDKVYGEAEVAVERRIQAINMFQAGLPFPSNADRNRQVPTMQSDQKRENKIESNFDREDLTPSFYQSSPIEGNDDSKEPLISSNSSSYGSTS